MSKENISLTQLYTLMVNYLLGSSIVVGLAKEAKQDAWISISIATLIGMGVFFFYYHLIKPFPGKNLYDIMEFCFSRPVTIILSVIYIIYFFYMGARVIRSFAEMIEVAILPETPIEVILLPSLLLLAYILYLGLEILARVAEVFTPYIFGFFLFLVLFSPMSDSFKVVNILPVLGEGLKPVFKAIFPELLVFPFGELIVFTIVFASIRELKKAKKIAFYAVLSAGISLIIGSVLMIMTLGVDVLESAIFPLLSTGRRVSIGDFLERIDPLVVFIMTLGVIIKCGLYFYCGFKGLEYVFRKPYRQFVFSQTILISVFSLLIAFNLGDHLAKASHNLVANFHLMMQFGIPGLVFLFLFIKNKKVNKMDSNAKSIN